MSTHWLQAIRPRILTTAAARTVLITLFGTLGAVLLARAVSRSLSQFESAANRTAHGEVETTVRIRTWGEVGALAESFTNMTQRLALSRATLADYGFFFSSRRRHTRCLSDWSSDVCSSD